MPSSSDPYEQIDAPQYADLSAEAASANAQSGPRNKSRNLMGVMEEVKETEARAKHMKEGAVQDYSGGLGHEASQLVFRQRFEPGLDALARRGTCPNNGRGQKTRFA